jgi:hypothetical protein
VPLSAVIALLRTHHRPRSKKLKIGFFAAVPEEFQICNFLGLKFTIL